MEERLREVEDFQKRWKFYFWCALVIAGLASVFFGIQVNQVSKKIDELSKSLITKESEVKELEKRLSEIKSTADRAFARAGDLEFAVSETKKAFLSAKESAHEAAAAGDNASQSSEQALKAAQKSEAVSITISKKLREIELMLSDMKKSINQAPPQKNQSQNKPKELLVEINGSSMNIRFEEGDSPYEKVKLNQNFYEGVVYVPKGYIAIITGYSTFGDFFISNGLKGRVIDNLRGSSNTWKYIK